jgi:hypothetical protein
MIWIGIYFFYKWYNVDMKTTTKIIIILVVLVSLVYLFNRQNSADVEQTSDSVPLPSDFLSVRPGVSALPTQSISEEEKQGLLYMREEEKLARDVYITLFEKWGVPIFSNISQSEQTHTEAVRAILVKYNIKDPVTNDAVGVFVNAELKKLFDDLVKRGEVSVEEALSVGAFIEDLDIKDLQNNISKTDNEDIKLVYENLMRGSRNHLRSFVSQLKSRGVTYKPEYITAQEYESIIASPKETGSGGTGRGWGNN